MVFADWDIEFTGGGSTGALTTVTPLNGSSSLEFTSSGGSNRSASATIDGVAAPRGIGRGKIRTLIEDRSVSAATVNIRAGIYCLAGNNTFQTGSGALAYILTVNASTGNLDLIRVNSFTANSTALASFAMGFTKNTTWPIELEWNEDSAGEIGGYHFIARSGTSGSTDFGTLVERFQYVDPTSPAHTGYEGLILLNDFNAAEWTFDDTSIFTIA